MNSIVSCPLSCEKRLRPIGFSTFVARQHHGRNRCRGRSRRGERSMALTRKRRR